MQRLNRWTGRIMAFFCICSLFLTQTMMVSYAELVNIEANEYFTQSKISQGKTGKLMEVSFEFTADKDYEHAYAGIAYDQDVNLNTDPDKDNVNSVVSFPFELTAETTERKSLGKLKEGQKKTVTLTARVRRDATDGYYGVQVYVSASKDSSVSEVREYINVWISKDTEPTTAETTADTKTAAFVLGENQDTPYGVYPNVMDFPLNLRNNGIAKAYDVTAMLIPDKDDKVFPFDINEISYNHHYDVLDVNQTVVMNYSFMIRKSVYSGFYPIKMKITYREKENAELKSYETEFYVHVKNKEIEESTTKEAPTELADKDRTKARLIVDSYQTIPEKVIAGQEFELVLNFKNASADLKATNILFAFESEKASDSAVFSSVSGANSVVVDKLDPGEIREIRLRMQSKAGVDQRSYTLKINEKFDSPQFKNAEESVSIDIPVNQIARVTVGTIAVSPETISVGGEADISFPISNSGRVTLYNVMVKFSAPFIKENEVYVGNIKPGETGNVSAYVLASDFSTEDAKVKLTISYEDENGEITTLDKEAMLLVTEELPEDGMMAEDMMQEEMDTEHKKLPLPLIFGSAAGALAIITGAVVIARRRKNRE